MIEINQDMEGFQEALLRHGAILNLFEKDIPVDDMSGEQAEVELRKFLALDTAEKAMFEHMNDECLTERQFQWHRAVLIEASGYILAAEHEVMIPTEYSMLEDGVKKFIAIDSDPIFQAALFLVGMSYQGGRRDLFSKLAVHSSISNTIKGHLTSFLKVRPS